jgi:hypothetical protein
VSPLSLYLHFISKKEKARHGPQLVDLVARDWDIASKKEKVEDLVAIIQATVFMATP